jgi:hypothetical protein
MGVVNASPESFSDGALVGNADAQVAHAAQLLAEGAGRRVRRTDAALVLMHTRAAPKQRLQDPGHYPDVVQDVLGFLADRMRVAMARGVPAAALILDPGPDFAKTPSQTIDVLRHLNELHALGRPLLMAVSRKDFVGALTGRRPSERLAGTLAAVGYCTDAAGTSCACTPAPLSTASTRAPKESATEASSASSGCSAAVRSAGCSAHDRSGRTLRRVWGGQSVTRPGAAIPPWAAHATGKSV